MIVKGYYEIYVEDEINSEDAISIAKKSFDYAIQDREIHSWNLTWKTDEGNKT